MRQRAPRPPCAPTPAPAIVAYPELRKPGTLDPAHLPEVLWVEDVAVVLGKKPDSIRSLMRARKVPSCKMGNRLYCLRTDLLEYLRVRGAGA